MGLRRMGRVGTTIELGSGTGAGEHCMAFWKASEICRAYRKARRFGWGPKRADTVVASPRGLLFASAGMNGRSSGIDLDS